MAYDHWKMRDCEAGELNHKRDSSNLGLAILDVLMLNYQDSYLKAITISKFVGSYAFSVPSALYTSDAMS